MLKEENKKGPEYEKRDEEERIGHQCEWKREQEWELPIEKEDKHVGEDKDKRCMRKKRKTPGMRME